MDYNTILNKMKKEKRIPKTLIEYIIYGCNNQCNNRLLERLDNNYDYTIDLLADTINRTSSITKLDPDEVIKCTDLHTHDQHFLRMNRALGEMRIVIYLDSQKFSKIRLIKSKENEIGCDIIAYKGNNIVVIEVTLSSDLEQLNETNKIYRFNSEEKILNKIEGIFSTKKRQLITCKSKYNADKMILAVILDEINQITALTYQDDFDKYSLELYNNTSLKDKCGLILQMQELVSMQGIII